MGCRDHQARRERAAAVAAAVAEAARGAALRRRGRFAIVGLGTELRVRIDTVLRGGGSERRHARRPCAPAPAWRVRRAAAAVSAHKTPRLFQFKILELQVFSHR